MPLRGLRRRRAGRRNLGSVSVPFDFDEVFDADYLFFYEPLLTDVTEADVDGNGPAAEARAGPETGSYGWASVRPLHLTCGQSSNGRRLLRPVGRVEPFGVA